MRRTAFLLLMFAIGSVLGASCGRQHQAVAPDSAGPPVCTSTVSCPFPPPRHHE